MQVVLKAQRVSNERLEGWIQDHLRADDWVVIESTGSAWHIYDLLAKRVDKVKVALPQMVKLIAAAPVKTDGRDVFHLARLLAVGWLPEVWVPDLATRDLRGLIAQRMVLIKKRTQLRNQLHAILQRHNIVLPADSSHDALFEERSRPWWDGLAISDSERLRLKQDWLQIEQLTPLITECEAQIYQCSTAHPWRDQAAYLMQFAGVGMIVAMTILSAIGDISRFANAKQLVGYAGLGTYVHVSGQTRRQGSISKRGRAELRYVLVEAAWKAVDHSDYWRTQFERLCRRKPKGVAIVAIARRILVAMWHTLSKHQPDHHANPAQVAKKFLRWSIEMKKSNRGGQSIAEFVRTELDRLGVAQDIGQIPHGQGKPTILPPSQRSASCDT